MGIWRTGTLGYWDEESDGMYKFETDPYGVAQMVEAIDDTGNEAVVTKQLDAEGFTILAWRVQTD